MMKFFKYLIFIFLITLSFHSYSATKTYCAISQTSGFCGTTENIACEKWAKTFASYGKYEVINTLCYAETASGSTIQTTYIRSYDQQITCPTAGTAFLKSFPAGNPIPTVQCVKHPDGTSCKYENKDAANKVNNMGSTQQVFLYSVGTQPVSNCTDQFAGSCNSNDPYGGCYTPPNDKCTRGSDGSIYCPDGAPPPKVETGCTGSATYCERPKGGCGSDYVSGSYNGKAVCVKKSGNTGNNNGTGNGNTPTPPGGSTSTTNNSDGSKTTVTSDANGNPVSTTVTGADGSSSTTSINKDGTSTTITKNPDGTSSTATGTTTTVKNPDGSTTTTTVNNNNTTVINNNNNSTTTTTTNPAGGGNHMTGGTTVVQQAPPVDMSGVISAINAVSEKISWLKDELSTSINDVSGKLDGTNEKLDQTNTKLDESNQNLKDIKDVLEEIKNKTPNNSTETPDNGKKLDDIKQGIDKSNGFLEEIKNWLTQENNLPENEKPIIQEHNVGDYEKSYVSWSASCPPDVQIPISLMGQSSTLVLKWSPWCELLSKIRWAIIACAYFSAAYIILGMRG